jgi:acetyltransferase
MGGAEVSAGEAILQQASIPTFPFPDTAAGAFNHMWRYSRYLHALYETPSPQDDGHAPDRAAAEALIAGVRETGRAFMTEAESKRLLALYGIPTVPTQIAASEDQAVVAAEKVGFPVVLKLHSETITHKTDVGGVCLNLADRDAVRSAYRGIRSSVCARAGREHFLGVTVQPMIKLEGSELIVGCSPDSQFGPVLLFGTGGQLVEVLHDRALALPPLTSTLARRMMERTRIFTALKGVRGRDPVDLAALERLLVRFSQLVVEQPGIKEIDINPLLAAPGRLLALDARVVVYGPGVSDDQLPRPAIKPYPTQYVVSRTLADGTPITIRPIRPEDEPLLVHFHEVLSENTVRLRYFQSVNLSRRVAHERLTRICFISYDREMVLVADSLDPETDRHQILAVGRLSRLRRRDEAELALLVRDDAQNKGLGTEILRRLLDIGRDERIRCFQADILPQNRAMQHICQKLGFHLEGEDPSVVKAELEL